jgi:hypothetical protein
VLLEWARTSAWFRCREGWRCWRSARRSTRTAASVPRRSGKTRAGAAAVRAGHEPGGDALGRERLADRDSRHRWRWPQAHLVKEGLLYTSTYSGVVPDCRRRAAVRDAAGLAGLGHYALPRIAGDRLSIFRAPRHRLNGEGVGTESRRCPAGAVGLLLCSRSLFWSAGTVCTSTSRRISSNRAMVVSYGCPSSPRRRGWTAFTAVVFCSARAVPSE